MKPSPFADLAGAVLSAWVMAGCTECTEATTTDMFTLPDERCDVGRCEEWRTQPCAKTCEAFVPANAVEVTGCDGPMNDPRRGLVVECTYVTQSCTTSPSFGKGRPQAAYAFSGPLLAADAVGAYFAVAAEAEESSVHAFRELAAALAEAGAPAALVEACLHAAADEERHRVIMTALATRFGAVPARAQPRRSRWPDLEALARENAEHGCVEERWSALETVHAALFATDPVIRAALSSVARDEARHAFLADEIDGFLASRLTSQARRRLDRVRARARDRLRRALQRMPDDHPVVVARLVPERRLRERLLGFLDEGASCAA